MKRINIIQLADCLAADCKVIDQDLKGEYNYDVTAIRVLENLEDRVSIQIYDMIRDMLLGFEDGMQLEIAACDSYDWLPIGRLHLGGVLPMDC